jgi:hypothetical protein
MYASALEVLGSLRETKGSTMSMTAKKTWLDGANQRPEAGPAALPVLKSLSCTGWHLGSRCGYWPTI